MPPMRRADAQPATGHRKRRLNRLPNFPKSRQKVLVCRQTKGILRPSTRRWNVDGNNERLLTPGEVAALFRVDPKTVTRWAASGRITSIRTPGGHRRFRESEVRALLRGDSEPAPQGHPAALRG